MLIIQKKYYPSFRVITRSFFFAGLIVGITGCIATLPKPGSNDSSMIIMSIEAKHNLGTNKPDVLVISRQSDGKEFSYTGRDDKYYFFTNLPPGIYQIKTASIYVTGNLTKEISTQATSFFPFDNNIIQLSTTRLHAGEVAFMGSITAEGTAKFYPSGAIDITDVRLSKSEQEKREVYDYFKKEFKDSLWVNYIK